jgi:hypothetical protein
MMKKADSRSYPPGQSYFPVEPGFRLKPPIVISPIFSTISKDSSSVT